VSRDESKIGDISKSKERETKPYGGDGQQPAVRMTRTQAVQRLMEK